MLSILQELVSQGQAGTILVLAVAIFSLIQYLLNRQQTKQIGTNHLEHLKEAIGGIIKEHEAQEYIFNQKMVDSLNRMENTLTRIETRMNGKRR